MIQGKTFCVKTPPSSSHHGAQQPQIEQDHKDQPQPGGHARRRGRRLSPATTAHSRAGQTPRPARSTSAIRRASASRLSPPAPPANAATTPALPKPIDGRNAKRGQMREKLADQNLAPPCGIGQQQAQRTAVAFSGDCVKCDHQRQKRRQIDRQRGHRRHRYRQHIDPERAGRRGLPAKVSAKANSTMISGGHAPASGCAAGSAFQRWRWQKPEASFGFPFCIVAIEVFQTWRGHFDIGHCVAHRRDPAQFVPSCDPACTVISTEAPLIRVPPVAVGRSGLPSVLHRYAQPRRQAGITRQIRPACRPPP